MDYFSQATLIAAISMQSILCGTKPHHLKSAVQVRWKESHWSTLVAQNGRTLKYKSALLLSIFWSNTLPVCALPPFADAGWEVGPLLCASCRADVRAEAWAASVQVIAMILPGLFIT